MANGKSSTARKSDLPSLTTSNVFARAPRTPSPETNGAGLANALAKLDVTPANPLTLPPRDRGDPTFADVLMHDPTLPMSTEARVLLAYDLQRWSHRILLPVVRLVAMLSVFFIRCTKRILPSFSMHRTLDSVAVWFLRRCTSADAAQLMLRHFLVETSLLAFIAKNTNVAEPTLRPTHLEDLRDGAFREHDLAAYNVVIDVGVGRSILAKKRDLDFSMLDIAALDDERERKRFMKLDFETALHVLHPLFAWCLNEREYERMVNRVQLDESVCAMLADLTGDATFRTWAPVKFPAWISVRRDVPKELFMHVLVNEYAHTQLTKLAREQA